MNSNRKPDTACFWPACSWLWGLVLPFLTGQIPQFGSMLLPMHIPVLLCGFVCGWPFGLVVGLITPVLRSLMFGMPPMFPVAVAMAFELAAYGFMTGLLYKLLPKKVPFIYVTLVAACGAAWSGALVTFLLVSSAGNAFTFSAFWLGVCQRGSRIIVRSS